MFHSPKRLLFAIAVIFAASLTESPAAPGASKTQTHKPVRAVAKTSVKKMSVAAKRTPVAAKKMTAAKKMLVAKRVTVAKKAAVAKKVTAAKKVTTAKPAAKYGRVPTPPDSYLQYKVYTVDQLVAQVQANSKIRALYARHFSIPESRVVSYMKANLVESFIPKTGKYKVYCAHRNGQIYAVRQTFRKGTKVFALRNGEPVMKWVCGNPLSNKLPPTKVVPVAEKVGESIESLTPTDLADVFVPSELGPIAAAPILTGPTILGAAPVFFGGGSGLSGLGFLFPIGFILGSGGGGNGGGGGGFSPPPPASFPVPEPTTPMILAALTLTAGMGIARRKIVGRRRSGK